MTTAEEEKETKAVQSRYGISEGKNTSCITIISFSISIMTHCCLQIIRLQHPSSVSAHSYLSDKGLGHVEFFSVPLIDGHTDIIFHEDHEVQINEKLGPTYFRLMSKDPIVMMSLGLRPEEKLLNAIGTVLDQYQYARNLIFPENELLRDCIDREIVRLEKLQKHYQKQVGELRHGSTW